MRTIKIKAYLSIFFALVVLLPYEFTRILIAFSILFLFLANLEIGKLAKTRSLNRNFTLATIFISVATLLAWLHYLFAIFGLILGVAGLFFGFMYYKELRQILRQDLFIVAFILYFLGLIALGADLDEIIGLCVLCGGKIIELIAWIRFKEISLSNGDYSLFKSKVSR